MCNLWGDFCAGYGYFTDLTPTDIKINHSLYAFYKVFVCVCVRGGDEIAIVAFCHEIVTHIITFDQCIGISIVKAWLGIFFIIAQVEMQEQIKCSFG